MKSHDKHAQAPTQALGYVRVSTEDQVRDGVSLDAQRAKIRRYGALHELALADVIVDAGVSGAVPFGDRPGGARVLEAVQSNLVGAVVVYKLDRLGRRTLDVLNLVETLTEAGVALHSISEKLDTESAIGRFVLRTLASLAEMERDQVRERTSLAMHHKASRGEVVSRAPRGLRIEHGRLVPDPTSDGLRMLERARALRNQGLTYATIAQKLTAEGFKPIRRGAGPTIAAATVRYMLHNPRYAAHAT
jgi:DNA invertase Pin-like site-specific DNA recombinase